MNHAITKAAVKSILQNWQAYGDAWSLQGFGMLRLYLSDDVRLHVWNSIFAVPGVSRVHDHPWHFESLIVAGRLVNGIYVLDDEMGDDYLCQTLRCGPGGGPTNVVPPEPVKLRLQSIKAYEQGEIYAQRADEIHVSAPEDGTVTIIERDFLADPDHARVFWPADGQWVSAEPRPATHGEVKQIVEHSLAAWF